MSLSTDTAGPFDVRTEDLKQIDAGQAVDLFRQLLVIEAAKLGVPITGVDVPSDINTSDGGIDAEVSNLAGVTQPNGLIFNGLTSYQIKTGKFSASIPSDIRSLLVQPKHASGKEVPTKDQLQPKVRACFDKSGTFVVVLFGAELVNPEENHGVAAISEFMAAVDPAYATVSVKILRANQLCSAIKTIAPGIALRLNRIGGHDTTFFHDLEFLGESCDLEVEDYQPTEQLNDLTQQITQAVNGVGAFRHVRVLGDAGSGKTHLIYRALSTSKLGSCLLYCPDPEGAVGSGPLNELIRMSATTTVILFADDCTLDIAEELVAFFKRRATKMLLITADNVAEPSTAHANVELIDVPRLAPPIIAEIFKGYGVPAENAEWLAALCEGSPRAAHKLGQYVNAHPEEQPTQHLAHLDMYWDRIVCAPNKVESVEGRDKLTVLRTLALFRHIAWDNAEGQDVQAAVLWALQQLESSFSPKRLADAVEAMRRRRVLQGQRVLIISPQLLHVSMWKSWFDRYEKMVDVIKLRAGLTGRAQGHFDAMLSYAKESRAATALSERLMGKDGPFASLAGFAAAGGSSLFFAVAQANPKAALRRFADALGRESIEARKLFQGDERRTAVHRLEQLAVPRDTFFEAADCLLLLAESENENWSNNSTGVLVSLFNLGYDKLAASEMAPRDKLQYLNGLLHSTTEFHRQIAVRALSESLQPFMSRTAIEETIGLRRLPDRWMPKTMDELHDSYVAHVDLLGNALNFLPQQEAQEAARGILLNVRSLILAPMAPKIIEFLRRVSAMPALRDECIEALVATLHYEGKALPANVKADLEALLVELTDSSFANKLRRHAGMKLVEDHFDVDGNYSDEASPVLVQLVVEAIAKPELLAPELKWLVTEEAKNGFQYGQLLGKADTAMGLWPAIHGTWVQEGDKRSDFFVGGYLSALYERDVTRWEQVVGQLLAEPAVRLSVLGVVWRSGMTDSMANKLLAMAESRELDPRSFRLFVYGGVVNRMPLAVVYKAVELMMGDGTDPLGADAALDVINSRMRGQADDSAALAKLLERVLDAQVFIEGAAGAKTNNMLQYHWNEAATRLLALDADAAARVAVRCIDHFGSENSVTSGYFGEPLKFLSSVTRDQADVVWPTIARRLTDHQREAGTWRMMNWLRGGRARRGGDASGMNALPPALVFDWIDGDVEERAPVMAQYCPPAISQPDEPPSFARQMLVRYGALKSVRSGLHSNNFTEGWSGPASEHYRQKLNAVEAHLNVEIDENVKAWLLEHKERLEHSIERETERELDENEG
ncbi:hypothetical protein J2W30_002250 [Variovorax boronicumulans]|uniref:hypothetical protein n=1 Tax=Variovorax boronicumulans TaxID=436515 RepID=UPI002788A406|nr:hypothetical protein [Variovorax boronicumulans]MDQ0034495.1 hypothetical protein [Variovorax boronicumulans]